jgi:hypothetical protein
LSLYPRLFLQGRAFDVNVRYRVDLSQSERDELGALVSGGKLPVRRLKRMQILLAADAGVGDEAIAASVQTSGSTIYRTKKRFVEINLDAALSLRAAAGRGSQAERQGGGAVGGLGLLGCPGGLRPLDLEASGQCPGRIGRTSEHLL